MNSVQLVFCCLLVSFLYTLSVQNIKNTFLILSCTPFCPQNSLNLSGHGLYMLSESVQPPGFFTHCADRNKHLMINETWCDYNIQEPDLEFLTNKCRPHYLPREFSSIIITGVYIPLPNRYLDGPEITKWTLCKTGNHIS